MSISPSNRTAGHDAPGGPAALRRLRLEWAGALAFTSAAAAMVFWLLTASQSLAAALAWASVSGPVAALIFGLIYRSLPLNHRRDQADLLPTLGLGTWLTILRGVLLACLAGFLALPEPSGWLAWLPGGLSLSAGVADYLDGAAARATNHSTALGEKLDMDLDALGILVAPLLGVKYGQLPVWYLVVSGARYLFMAGVWWLKRTGRPIYTLPESADRRFMAGFQMGLSGAVLMPVFVPPVTHIVATIFMISFVAGFVRDWLAVGGAIDLETESYRAWMTLSKRVFQEWLPVFWRMAVVVVFVASMAWGKAAAAPTILLILEVAAIMALSIGLMGRLAALILLLAVGVMARSAGLDAPSALLAILSSVILVLGSGRLSIWRPDEAFLRYRAGAEPSANQP